MLQNLEQAGFVRRETPAHDARQKKVVLTDAGCEFEQRMRRRITATERQIRKDIPEEDMQVFYRVIRRMIENLS